MGNSVSQSTTSSQSNPIVVRPETVEMPATRLALPTGHGALRGKVYAITGGASGIGLGTAKVLSERGATVCIADVDTAAMKEAEEYFSSQNVPFMISRVDVSKRAEVDDWIDSVVKEQGRLDGAANVAGVIGKVHGITPVQEMDDNQWDRIIAVNLTGTMYSMRAQLRNIVDGGSIVNVTSIHGLKGACDSASVLISTNDDRVRQSFGV